MGVAAEDAAPGRDVTGEDPTPWSVDQARRAAVAALATVGQRPDELCLVRLGENAIFRTAPATVILRVARPTTSFQDVARAMNVASQLAESGLPVGAPALDWSQGPIATPYGTVAFWHYYEPSHQPTDFYEFGRTLRLIHETHIPLSLPQFDPFSATQTRLQNAEEHQLTPVAWIHRLRERAFQVEARVRAEANNSGLALVHGDAHSGNVIMSTNGFVLVDLDNLSYGLPIVDLVPTFVQERRFGSSSERLDTVLSGYGGLSRTEIAASPLVAVRELTMVTWLLQQYGLNETVNWEIAKRVDSILDDDPAMVRWAPF